MEPKQVVVSSREELVAKADESLAAGFEVLASDDPVRGVRGILVCGPSPVYNIESETRYVWGVYGRILHPQKIVTGDPDRIQAFFREKQSFIRADDVISRYVGYVSFDRAEQYESDVLYVPWTRAASILPSLFDGNVEAKVIEFPAGWSGPIRAARD